MSDRIYPLDGDERAAVISALSGQLPGAWSALHVDKIISAINGVRCGEPVGTVKRSDTGIIALLTAETSRPWFTWGPDGHFIGTHNHREMSHWPVIFRPEAQA
jgi:hypothetical protein